MYHQQGKPRPGSVFGSISIVCVAESAPITVAGPPGKSLRTGMSAGAEGAPVIPQRNNDRNAILLMVVIPEAEA